MLITSLFIVPLKQGFLAWDLQAALMNFPWEEIICFHQSLKQCLTHGSLKPILWKTILEYELIYLSTSSNVKLTVPLLYEISSYTGKQNLIFKKKKIF